MKAQPLKFEEGRYVECHPIEATHLKINQPGPAGVLILPVILKGTRNGTGCWSWNGDTEKPTLRPSLATSSGRNGSIKTHAWVNDGVVQFLNDCSHDLAGKTLDLLDIEKEGV